MSVLSGLYPSMGAPMTSYVAPSPIYNTKYLLEISEDEDGSVTIVEGGLNFTLVFDKTAYEEAKFQNARPCAPKRIIISSGQTDIAVFIPRLAGKGSAFKFYTSTDNDKYIKDIQYKTLPIIEEWYPSLRGKKYFSLIGGNKEHIVYNKRHYKVQEDGKKYILCKKEKVYLSTIRGKYQYM